jgi:MazG family protein
MAEEKGYFAYPDVVRAISEKMIHRHPHVFGDAGARTPDGVRKAWEEIKQEERAAKPSAGHENGHLGDVPYALPALIRAVKLQNRAAEIGFDWPSAVSVTDKIAEEAQELAVASAEMDAAKVAEEFGDLLFAVANLARHLKVDPETALRAANAKFVRRFKVIERGLEASDKKLGEATLEEMEALWQEAKREEQRG